MTSPHPTTTWQAMQEGTVFYRRTQMYELPPNKLPELGNYIVRGCKCGGPIALMRDTSKIITYGQTSLGLGKNQVQVFSAAGDGLLLFNWDGPRIISFGWTSDERLILLNEEGTYRLYNLLGEYTQFSLGGEASELGVVDAKIHEEGFVALTGNLGFVEVKGWEGGRGSGLANPGISEPPTAWAVIPPDLNISRHAEVLLSPSSSSSIYTVDNLESVDQRLSQGPFSHISPSPNAKSLALLTYAGVLLVISSDFSRTMAEFDTNSVEGTEGGVKQVEWCGNDAIVVVWEGLVVLVGPFADTIQYTYHSTPYALTETDGIRIISTGVCDLIQKVPPSTLSIFRPGSSTPSAILFDAYESFSSHRSNTNSHANTSTKLENTGSAMKVDESIRSIKPELAQAVDECVDAAGREWDVGWQRRLMNAAKFGRSFLDFYNPTDFINMGQTLRVLNAVRHYEIGICVSYAQYLQSSPTNLITRLTSRNLHLLALRISNFLGLKQGVVLKHWACAKIAARAPALAGGARIAGGGDTSSGAIPAGGAGTEEDTDTQIANLIVSKFTELGFASGGGIGGGGDGVSYAEIAKRAWEVGRSGLATKLLDYETKASSQVPLLLTMKEDRLALEKAVDSGDTDLVYHVLLHLYNRLSLGAFFKLLESDDAGSQRLALASRLLQVYAREQNREMLRDFYYSDDRRVESAVLALEDAGRMTDPDAKIASIKSAKKFFGEDKDRGFEAKMMDENAKLLALQLQLDKETDGKVVGGFFGLSVNETIRTCILNGLGKKADRIKSDFGVPDKRFWNIKLSALIELKDFIALEEFANSKSKSPIGYEPFVKQLLKAGQVKEATSYVARCDPVKRPDLYADCGEWRLATKECKERGYKAKLEELRKKSPNSLVTREIEQALATMK